MTKKMFNWYVSVWQHKWWVFVYCFQFCWRLFWRAVIHDNSKLSKLERVGYAKLLPKLKGTTYGTPEYKQLLIELGQTLYEHYQANSHHPEHYADTGHDASNSEITYNYPTALPKMNLYDFVEMFCDWRAAIKKHADGDIVKSIKHNKKRFHYGDVIESILLNTVKK